MFSPASYDERVFGTLEKEPGATVAVSVARPESRGTIMATSADPSARPIIKPNYLLAARDSEVILAGIAYIRRIFAAPALAEHVVHETTIGDGLQSDEDLLAFARGNGTTLYHPVGTCKMGTDPAAVVDPRLKVHGIGGLRVIDASIMPAVTTANTNAPAIMIAEKGASMIREDAAAVA